MPTLYMQVSCWLSTSYVTKTYICLLSATWLIIFIWIFVRLPIVCNFLLVASLVYHISILAFVVGCSTHCNDLEFYRLPIVYNLRCLLIKNISAFISLYETQCINMTKFHLTYIFFDIHMILWYNIFIGKNKGGNLLWKIRQYKSQLWA